MAHRIDSQRVLKLGIIDAVLYPITYKYTFEKGELDVKVLEQALEKILEVDFWPLKGILKGTEIVVEATSVQHWFVYQERPDLILADVRARPELSEYLAANNLGVGERVLRLCLTKVADGVLLGVNLSHTYGDAHTIFRLFMRALSDAYSGREFPWKGQIINDRSLFAEGSVVAKTTCSPYHRVIEWNPGMGAATLTAPDLTAPAAVNDLALLFLTGPQVTKLKELAKAKSRLGAAYALIWKAMGSAKITFPVNFRESPTRWSPVVPFTYAGNVFLMYGAVHPNAKNATLEELAQLYHAGVDSCNAVRNQVLLGELSHMLSKTPHGGAIAYPFEEDCLSIGSWTRLDMAPDFGGARPKPLWSALSFLSGVFHVMDTEVAFSLTLEGDGLELHGSAAAIPKVAALLDELLK